MTSPPRHITFFPRLFVAIIFWATNISLLKGEFINNKLHNTVSLLSANVTLLCKGLSNEGIIWKSWKDNRPISNETVINSVLYSGGRLNYVFEPRFRVNNSLENTSALGIQQVQISDAGIYSCETAGVGSNQRFFAFFIILESDPVCHIIQDLQRDSVTVWCRVNYFGSWAPSMSFHIISNKTIDPKHTVKDVLTASTNGNVVSNATFTGLQNVDAILVKTYFDASAAPIFLNTLASNAPDYLYQWFSAVHSVTPEHLPGASTPESTTVKPTEPALRSSKYPSLITDVITLISSQSTTFQASTSSTGRYDSLPGETAPSSYNTLIIALICTLIGVIIICVNIIIGITFCRKRAKNKHRNEPKADGGSYRLEGPSENGYEEVKKLSGQEREKNIYDHLYQEPDAFRGSVMSSASYLVPVTSITNIAKVPSMSRSDIPVPAPPVSLKSDGKTTVNIELFPTSEHSSEESANYDSPRNKLLRDQNKPMEDPGTYLTMPSNNVPQIISDTTHELVQSQQQNMGSPRGGPISGNMYKEDEVDGYEIPVGHRMC